MEENEEEPSEDPAESMGRDFGNKLMGEIQSFSASIDLSGTAVELGVELEYGPRETWFSLMLLGKPDEPEPLPEAFYRVPADADVAAFFQGGRTEEVTTAGTAFWQQAIDVMPDYTPAQRDEIFEKVKGTLLTGDAFMFAHGSDVDASRRAVDALTRTKRPSSKAIREGNNTLAGWSLIWFPEPLEVWKQRAETFIELDKIHPAAKAPTRGGATQDDEPPDRENTKLRNAVLPKTIALPPATAYYIIERRPNPDYEPTAPDDLPPFIAQDLHVLLFGGRTGSWLSIAPSLSLATATTHKVLNADVQQRRRAAAELSAHQGSGGGFFRLTSVLLPFLDLDTEEQRSQSDLRLRKVERMPNAGRAPTFWTLETLETAKADHHRVRLRAQVSPAVVADLMALALSEDEDQP